MLFMGEEFATTQPFLFFCDFGPELANAVTEGRRREFSRFAHFADPAVRDLLERLIEAGLAIEAPARETLPLTGRVFLFTGTLDGLSRDEAKQLVKSLGGQVASGISQRVTDVVVGAKAGGKKKKAEELGLHTLDEAALRTLIDSAAAGGRNGL